MKILISLCLFCFLFVGSSFVDKPKEAKVYSCNKEINAYVVTHVRELKKMSLPELQRYDESSQRAIFNTFDPGKRRVIWREKLIKDSQRFQGWKRDFLLWLADWQMDEEHLKVSPTKEELIASFGKEDAIKIFTKLDNVTNDAKIYLVTTCGSCPTCSCSHQSDFCMDACGSNLCEHTVIGCGYLMRYSCTGICMG